MTVSQNSNKAHTPIDFASIQSLTENEAKAVDQLILEELTSDVVLINQIGHYIINSGGKRLRPMLLLLTAKALNYQQDNHLVLAAVIEFIHTATLLHDDVVDESDLRRGKETANAVWGNAASVLVGDYLYSSAFEMMVRTNNMRVMEILSKTTTAIAEGEVLQLLNCNSPATTEAKYLEVISRKTAILFSAATRLGAVLADASPEIEQNLADYGQHLGIAFQLIDDALDYTSSKDELGKNLGDDLAEGKPTLPLIYAIENGTEEQANIIIDAIKTGNRDSFNEVYAIVKATNAITYTEQRADDEAQQAIDALSNLPDSEFKNALEVLARFSVQRNY
ncbi:octaprenyl diphosphate synthase [Methylococcaceae bacterium HT4]|nr:octaprenyl diphosphate synthase [Methyloprofundus sp.]TXK96839.1 octaprenyl diphosphate synthase [Methylococcaceae bacterium CS4]TXL01176.1 octaprenyl diphosphate synthase [Methylococcaceae bacterium CS5]TXL07675.1 octaprenyl diphosphate synthase [Methylococcaceae bacterium CS3]TXL07757.1 octaprenyl diphosphate synthase [Methylococcaceae bacterium CS1]TXL12216.1 octaprenyl diphosphate synthase [Methylococcaceae bacterium CS2]TXL12975.1 octaprenyl diphosphate synthase [Methylococcaceae bact